MLVFATYCHIHKIILCVSVAGSRGDQENELVAEGDVSDMAASLSSHQYKSYNVTLVHKIASNVHVQLGITFIHIFLVRANRSSSANKNERMQM